MVPKYALCQIETRVDNQDSANPQGIEGSAGGVYLV